MWLLTIFISGVFCQCVSSNYVIFYIGFKIFVELDRIILNCNIFLKFQIAAIQLNRLSWRYFIAQYNPVMTAINAWVLIDELQSQFEELLQKKKA